MAKYEGVKVKFLVNGIEEEYNSTTTTKSAIFAFDEQTPVVTITDFNFKMSMYEPMYFEVVLSISGRPSFSTVRDTLIGAKAEIKFSTGATSSEPISKYVFVYRATPKFVKNGNTLVTLDIYTYDKLLDLQKFSRAYTGARLGKNIMAEIPSFDKPGYGLKSDSNPRIMSYTLKDVPYEIIQPYTVQYNETYRTMINRVANRCGEFLYWHGDKLQYGLHQGAEDAPTALKVEMIDEISGTSAELDDFKAFNVISAHRNGTKKIDKADDGYINNEGHDNDRAYDNEVGNTDFISPVNRVAGPRASYKGREYGAIWGASYYTDKKEKKGNEPGHDIGDRNSKKSDPKKFLVGMLSKFVNSSSGFIDFVTDFLNDLAVEAPLGQLAKLKKIDIEKKKLNHKPFEDDDHALIYPNFVHEEQSSYDGESKIKSDDESEWAELISHFSTCANSEGQTSDKIFNAKDFIDSKIVLTDNFYSAINQNGKKAAENAIDITLTVSTSLLHVGTVLQYLDKKYVVTKVSGEFIQEDTKPAIKMTIHATPATTTANKTYYLPEPLEQQTRKMDGNSTAVITDVDDPYGQQRVRVRFTWQEKKPVHLTADETKTCHNNALASVYKGDTTDEKQKAYEKDMSNNACSNYIASLEKDIKDGKTDVGYIQKNEKDEDVYFVNVYKTADGKWYTWDAYNNISETGKEGAVKYSCQLDDFKKNEFKTVPSEDGELAIVFNSPQIKSVTINGKTYVGSEATKMVEKIGKQKSDLEDEVTFLDNEASLLTKRIEALSSGERDSLKYWNSTLADVNKDINDLQAKKAKAKQDGNTEELAKLEQQETDLIMQRTNANNEIERISNEIQIAKDSLTKINDHKRNIEKQKDGLKTTDGTIDFSESLYMPKKRIEDYNNKYNELIQEALNKKTQLDSRADSTPWIRMASPMAGKDNFMKMKPALNTEVIVGFENGNIERPYVLGSLFQKGDCSLTSYINGKNSNGEYVPCTTGDYRIIGANGEGLSITDENIGWTDIVGMVGLPIFSTVSNTLPTILSGIGVKFDKTLTKIQDDKNLPIGGKVSIADKYGFYNLTMSSKDRKVSISSPMGNVSISAFQGISISAPNGDITINGKNITLKAGNKLTLISGTNKDNLDTSTKDITGAIGKLVAKMMISAATFVIGKKGVNLSNLRSVWEVVFKPLNGTMELNSKRHLLLEAGKGKAELPVDAMHYKDNPAALVDVFPNYPYYLLRQLLNGLLLDVNKSKTSVNILYDDLKSTPIRPDNDDLDGNVPPSNSGFNKYAIGTNLLALSERKMKQILTECIGNDNKVTADQTILLKHCPYPDPVDGNPYKFEAQRKQWLNLVKSTAQKAADIINAINKSKTDVNENYYKTLKAVFKKNPGLVDELKNLVSNFQKGNYALYNNDQIGDDVTAKNLYGDNGFAEKIVKYYVALNNDKMEFTPDTLRYKIIMILIRAKVVTLVDPEEKIYSDKKKYKVVKDVTDLTYQKYLGNGGWQNFFNHCFPAGTIEEDSPWGALVDAFCDTVESAAKNWIDYDNWNWIANQERNIWDADQHPGLILMSDEKGSMTASFDSTGNLVSTKNNSLASLLTALGKEQATQTMAKQNNAEDLLATEAKQTSANAKNVNWGNIGCKWSQRNKEKVNLKNNNPFK